MKPREKLLALLTGLAVVLFIIFTVVEPKIRASFETLAKDTEAAQKKLTDARVLVDSQNKIDRDWAEYRNASLPDRDPDQALRIITQWAREAGLSLPDGQTGRLVEGERFDMHPFTFSAQGTMRSVEQFLWSVQTSPIPLRVVSCSIRSRDEGKDQLDLSLTLTTIVKSSTPTSGKGDSR